jgi:hypothetical protein
VTPALPRLARVLGLLSSDFDNEVLTAARKAEAIRRQMGATWDELLGSSFAPAVPGEPAASRAHGSRQPDPPPHWRTMVTACRCRPRLLTEWELSFVTSVGGQSSLSRKQWTILHTVHSKAAA